MQENTNTNSMTLSEELAWRGLIHQTTFKDIKYIDENKLTIYHGFDASADSQTIGNLASMVVDLCFLRHGHKAIILAGGATSLIGDPGGRDKERPMQTVEAIGANVEAAKKQIQKIYGAYDFTLVNNLDWTQKIDAISFLRDIGKYFNVGEMIKTEYVASRLGEGGAGISFTEFSYALLQGYDFLHLYDTYGCTLQLCGSDQWTNCLAGVDLIRKKRGIETNVLTNPLIINKSTGIKFGKSEAGAVWLDAAKTSPFDFYQFWLNTDDESAQDYTKIFTPIQKPEFAALLESFNADRSTRLLQKYLAFETTKLVHGVEAAKEAEQKSVKIYEEGGLENATEIKVEAVLISENKINIVELMLAANIVDSKGKAKDLISGGGVYLNEEKVEEVEQDNPKMAGKDIILRVGKKKYYKIISE